MCTIYAGGLIHRTVLLTLALIVGFAAECFGQSEVKVYLDSTAQVIRGFGAANIVGWRPDMTDQEIETAFGMGEGKLGFSLLRVRIPPQESQWATNLRTAQEAHSMGVDIVASPWSPPAHMKTNNSLIGGSLREEMYGDYAEHLKAFSDYMADNGAPIYAVSVQNEPDVDVDYESCDWTPEEMLRFVKEHGDAVGTRLIAPESFQFRRDLSDPLLNDSEARENLDILGGHIYGGGLSPYPLAEEHGKEVWMTEHLVLDTGVEASIDTGVEIQNVMRAGMSAYIWWYIVRYYGPISDGESDEYRKGEITKRGYVMSQFSRFIRPGFVRVHTSLSRPPSVTYTAYKDSARVVIVAVNDGASPHDVTIAVEDGAIGRLSRYVTSATQDVERLDDVEPSANRLTVTLGAKSVTTFVSEYSTVGTGAGAAEMPSHGFVRNYPNPFSSTTAIEYSVAHPAHVTLEVFDITGRNVASLVNGPVAPGRHSATLSASGLPSGVYICRLEADGVVETLPVTLIR